MSEPRDEEMIGRHILDLGAQISQALHENADEGWQDKFWLLNVQLSCSFTSFKDYHHPINGRDLMLGVTAFLGNMAGTIRTALGPDAEREFKDHLIHFLRQEDLPQSLEITTQEIKPKKEAG